MQKDSITIGGRLKIFAQQRFGSIKELSKYLGIAPNLLSIYINNKSVPGGEILKKLANSGLNINWLLTGDGQMTIKPIGSSRLTYYLDLKDRIEKLDESVIPSFLAEMYWFDYNIENVRANILYSWVQMIITTINEEIEKQKQNEGIQEQKQNEGIQEQKQNEGIQEQKQNEGIQEQKQKSNLTKLKKSELLKYLKSLKASDFNNSDLYHSETVSIEVPRKNPVELYLEEKNSRNLLKKNE